MRREISTNTQTEKRVGYSRAVVIDDKRIYFSGTTSVDEQGETVGTNTYEQTINVFRKIKDTLGEVGFSPTDVVLIRAYLARIKDLSEFDKAFIEHFSDVKPACTVVGVSELVKPDLLVEIECIAEKAG